MPLRSDWSDAGCPIARSLDVVGDPWVLLVLREALTGATRFDQLREALGVADTVLSRRLSAMVDGDLLVRTPYVDQHRTRHEYLLTEAGRDLLPVLHALAQWGERHRSRSTGRLEVVHEECGQTSESADTCARCGTRLTADTVSWRRPRDDGGVTRLAR